MERSEFLIVSDFLNDRIVKWSERGRPECFCVNPRQTANGNAVDLRAGRFLHHSRRSVVRQEYGGCLTTMADRYGKGRRTSPNDVVVKSDGTIWFTDPDYGFLCPDDFGHGDKPEQDRNRVYRVVPETGEITSVSEDFDKPNGLAFSPDESMLYVGDTGRTHGEFRPHQLMAFDVVKNGTALANPRVFTVIEPWVPDGFRAGRRRKSLRHCGRWSTGVQPEGRNAGQDPHAANSGELLIRNVRQPDFVHRGHDFDLEHQAEYAGAVKRPGKRKPCPWQRASKQLARSPAFVECG